MNKVNICGIPHKIVEKKIIDGRSSYLGMITYGECLIELKKGQPPELYKQSLIHEVVHGMLVNIGRNDLSEDETFVQSLAMAINLTFDLKGEKHD